MKMAYSKILKPLTAAAIGIFMASTSVLAEGDPAKGRIQFNKCKSCHSLDEGNNRTGPSLYDIIGRAAGQVSNFSYSQAMLDSGLTWDTETLDAYLAKPRDIVPGGIMSFGGLRKPEWRTDIIAYLREQTAAE